MKIIYWSGSGNTEAMANLISEGVKAEGKEAESINISIQDVDSIGNDEIIVLGCPSMGDEELESDEFLPFLEKIEGDIKGKKIALFGSYGWGTGGWMEGFQEKINEMGGEIILESLIVNYAPEDNEADRCIEFGKELGRL